jgi:WD40 repeat protein
MTEPDDDAHLADLLAAYDEALAAGQPSSADTSAESTLLPIDVDRLRAARECLELLERCWPRRAAPPQPLERVGRFGLVRELGRGGFGIVYLADDPLLGRQVAVKVPHPEVLLSPQLRSRFVGEARAAARLEHPNLVPVYEAGEEGLLCYLVSAFCPGVTLRRWLDDRAAPVACRDAAALVAALAGGVAYMHSRGVCHRDIKPTNVLLPASAGGAADLAAPRLTDFGLAKVAEDGTERTRTGQLLGTPQYMAPEQIEGRVQDVGPASDVYALGVLLYELLTGQPPCRGRTDTDTMRRIAAEEPTPPRRLRRDVPRDLEAVCLKCLEKQPVRRYPSAQALAEDLRRFLAGQPTRAKPLTAWKRVGRWVRRRPGVAAALLLICAAAPALLAGGYWLRGPEPDPAPGPVGPAPTPVPKVDLKTRQIAHALQVAKIAERWNRGEVATLWTLLNELRPGPGEEDLRGFAWHYLYERGRSVRLLPEQKHHVFAVAFASDGRSWISADIGCTVRRWEAATDRPLAALKVHADSLGGMGAFTAGGGRLVKAAGHQAPRSYRLFLWDAGSPAPRWGPIAAHAEVPVVSPDGRTVAYVNHQGDPASALYEIRLWDTAAGTDRVLRPAAAVYPGALAFSSDGTALAIPLSLPTPDGKRRFPVEVWDVATGQRRWQSATLPSDVAALAFSPDGKTLATCCWDHVVHFLVADSGKELGWFRAGDPVERLVFSGDGTLLAVATHSHPAGDATKPGAVSLWEMPAGKKLAPELPLQGKVLTLAFAPDGRSLVVADFSRHLYRWEPFVRPAFTVLPAHKPLEAWAVAFSPDGQTLATAGDFGQLRLWDADTAKEKARLPGHGALVRCLAYSADGRRLASGGYDKKVKLWDATGQLVAICPAEDHVLAVAFSPTEKLLASAGGDKVVRLWDAEDGRPQGVLTEHTDAVFAVAFSPDGKLLASGASDRTIRLWDVAGRSVVRVLTTPAPVRALVFTPDGKTLVAGGYEGELKFWHVETGEVRVVAHAHAPKEVRKIVLSPDGKTLASAGMDRCVRLTCAATGCEQLCFADLPHTPSGLAFSPDGRRLAVALHDGTVRIWDARP